MKTIKSILFILPIVIVFLSFSHSNANESEDEEYFLYRYDTRKLQVGTLGLGRFFGVRASYDF